MNETSPGDASRASRMQAALQAALNPSVLVIEDDSARHAGHAGASENGESHYTVTIVSELFQGHTRVERARMVHHILGEEFSKRLHALSLILRSPADAQS